MSEFYSSSGNSSPFPMSSSDKAMDKYAAAKLNDRNWQRYSDTDVPIHSNIYFRIEILQTIPNGESALVVVRWVLNLYLPWYHARSILKSLCPTLSILWIRNQINNGYRRYVDQGSQAMLDISQLRHLASEFRTVPCQAVPAALAGVCPLQGDWTPEDNYWFNTRYQETFNLNKSFIIAGLLVSSLREKL